jgi:hypothetical protein
MPLKELTNPQPTAYPKYSFPKVSSSEHGVSSDAAPPIAIHIARDVDDEAVHGRKRKKKNRFQQR